MSEEQIGTTEAGESNAPRRGRPPRAPSPGVATSLSAPIAGAKPRRRLSEMKQQILPDTSGMDQNYTYRVVNEGKNGVGLKQLLDRGYEIVQSDQSLVTEEAGKAGSLTSQVQIVANGSSGEKGVLMRIRKDYHAEDQADKQRIVAQTETMTHLMSKDAQGTYAPKDETGQQVGIRIGR